MKVVVTGGAGFIGSAVVRRSVRQTDWRVVTIDKLTYAGNLESLAEAHAIDQIAHRRLAVKALPRVFDPGGTGPRFCLHPE